MHVLVLPTYITNHTPACLHCPFVLYFNLCIALHAHYKAAAGGLRDPETTPTWDSNAAVFGGITRGWTFIHEAERPWARQYLVACPCALFFFFFLLFSPVSTRMRA